VPLEAKERLLRQKACVIWLTGLPASGKSAVAAALEKQLCGGTRKRATALLDGDNLRHGLCSDLGFTPADRAENVRRVGEAARLLSCGGGGLLAIAALVSPYRAHREAVRRSLPPGRFVEVFVDSPLELCERRDPKGLYAASRSGTLRGLTGVDAPYEEPGRPEVVVRPREENGGAEAAAAEVVLFLEKEGLIPREGAEDGN
jgi:adenylyl-sulfate kinase